jgi:ribosomal-protein-alanine N-acetyltransferase
MIGRYEMNPNISIRNYRKEDKEVVLNLFRLNVPLYFSPSEQEELLYFLDHEIELYFVLEIEGKIVGSGGINFSGDETHAKISWDFLHPEYQGKSLGTKLLKHRLDILQKMDKVKTITVRTSQLAYRFYEKSGFKLKEVVTDYWAKGFDLYRMEL